MKKLNLIFGLTILAVSLLAYGCDNGAPGNDDSIYSKAGPHETTVERDVGPGSDYDIYRPADLDTQANFPLLTWGNATGTPNKLYDTILTHFASHGFIVIATHEGQSGQGEVLAQGLDFLIAENSKSSSKYYGKIDEENLGAAGHSQGGASSVVVAGNDSRVKAIVPIQPDCNAWVDCNNSDSIEGAVFAIAGGTDSLVSKESVQTKVYDALSDDVPAVFGVIEGMGHTGWFSNQVAIVGSAATAWFSLS